MNVNGKLSKKFEGLFFSLQNAKKLFIIKLEFRINNILRRKAICT